MIKKFLTLEDVIIPDRLIANDARKAGYNIGDLLNMPSLHNIWNQVPHADEFMLEQMYFTSNHYENSIVNIYCKNREHGGEIIPNIPLIIKSVDQFTNENKHMYADMLALIQTPTTLVVHVRNGDLDTEEEYITHIIEMATRYKYVILITGIHLDEFFKKNDMKIANTVNTINSILAQRGNIYVYLNTADVHLSLMRNAKNLLLHKGGFSCLGSIVASGNLFITDLFTHVNHSNWQSQVNKKYIVIPKQISQNILLAAS